MVGKIQIILLDILWSSSWQYKPRLAHSSTKHMQIVCECVHCFCPDLFLQIRWTSAVTSYIKTFCILFNLSKQVYIYIYMYNIFFLIKIPSSAISNQSFGTSFCCIPFASNPFKLKLKFFSNKRPKVCPADVWV